MSATLSLMPGVPQSWIDHRTPHRLILKEGGCRRILTLVSDAGVTIDKYEVILLPFCWAGGHAEYVVSFHHNVDANEVLDQYNHYGFLPRDFHSEVRYLIRKAIARVSVWDKFEEEV